MLTWMDDYRNKLKTAERAVELIESGNRVYVHGGQATPELLVDALLARAEVLRDVEVVQGLASFRGKSYFCRPEYRGHFRASTFFLYGDMRKTYLEGSVDYFPCLFSEGEKLFASGAMPIDVTLIHTSPPDEEGYLSLGIVTELALGAARASRHMIAQVNDHMPRTCGDCRVHISEVAAVVEMSEALPELPPAPISDLHRRIAGFIHRLIPDGATVEAGIGAIPDGVLECLADKKDIGIHTEIFSEGMIPLIESGVINNRLKTLHPNKVVAAITMGTKRVFDYVNLNPLIEFHPLRYTCDPYVIGQNEKMVAINNVMQIDLTGQVCSDSIGPVPYSGFGGQLDFTRGAARSKEGKPILVLPSTAKGDTLSRIVPFLDRGAGVVVDRAEVHYVVTEYGVVNLYGRNLRQRAEGLIGIAHPRFRNELYDAAVKLGYLEPKGMGVYAEQM